MSVLSPSPNGRPKNGVLSLCSRMRSSETKRCAGSSLLMADVVSAHASDVCHVSPTRLGMKDWAPFGSFHGVASRTAMGRPPCRRAIRFGTGAVVSPPGWGDDTAGSGRSRTSSSPTAAAQYTAGAGGAAVRLGLPRGAERARAARATERRLTGCQKPLLVADNG